MNITLDQEQADSLRELASTQGQSIETIVHEAVAAYPKEERDRDQRFIAFEQARREMRSHLPPSTTPEEIEADITAASEEVRAMRRATHGLYTPCDRLLPHERGQP